MNLLYKRSLFQLTALIVMLTCCGIAFAGVEIYYGDGVNFALSEVSAFVPGTTDDAADGMATLDASIKFDADLGQTLNEAVTTITFNPTYLNLIEARPSDGWTGIDPGDCLLDTVSSGELLTVQYSITHPSPIPADMSWRTVAHFDFELLCQSDAQVHSVQIEYNVASYTQTTLNNSDVYYVDESDEVTNGSVSIEDYVAEVWIADIDSHIEFEGVLGKFIEVPVLAQTNFRLGHIDFYVTYNTSKLELYSAADTSGYFWNCYAQQVSTDIARIMCIVLDTSFLTEFPEVTEVASLRFRVLGAWEGDTANLSISDTVAPIVYVGPYTCDALYDNDPVFHGGTLSIDNYVAAYSSVFTGGGTLSLTDDQATLKIKLANNFPTRPGLCSIVANLCLGTNLENDGLQPVFEATNFGLSAYGGACGTEVSLWTESDAGVLPMSADTAFDMVAFNIRPSSSFQLPTSFAGRFYPVTYQVLFDSDPLRSAQVFDSTGLVVMTHAAGTLTWDAPEIEYLMGEYYCPSVSSGSGLISQNYYLRGAFAVHGFRVKIKVAGAHNIYNVYPEDGVEVVDFDENLYKWVILETNDDWVDQEAGEARVKFASITYSYWGNTQMLLMDQPGPGHYETRSSTVSFVYAADSGYYMNDVADDDQHEVAIGGTLFNRWWVPDNNYDTLPNIRNIDMAGAGGLPKEYALTQNYPNPFNPTTEFWFALLRAR